ncbi:MAG: hypothetical protein IPM64_07050 [Phycisphaerales bacterium]|nr:hypothetical protein [Phycisphaerales bacterium]
MAGRFEPLDFSRLRLRSRAARTHKVDAAALARPTAAGCSFRDWTAALPDFLAVRELRRLAAAIVAARRAGRPVLLAFGGHVVKTGCGPLIIDLIRRGVVSAIATNGSGAIHDLELSQTGETSEEVADTIRDGTFGMVRETLDQMNAAARTGAALGLGRALGRLILNSGAPHAQHSIFAAAAQADIPATVHVALGTDTVHMSAEADGAAIGAATLADFREFCAVVAQLGAEPAQSAGGVYLNVGSAVVMPEVFLKAVSVARNLGHPLDGMHTANLDMLRHYRPTQNVLRRPVAAGHGHEITGPHELLLPLLRQLVVEAIDQPAEAGAAEMPTCRTRT